ncbi:phosphatase YcdX [Fundidesulfovibrio magnetotacticus]|uniref:Phosphatase YcdX n=1 Tax=Fundidesulfovibrio magnetotacticus TaxID=2730080 RepID=A0A6V8LQS3_9BACT|nr:PHP domain-containing protein [Fundidesulfovibrio magnetotacticus]GFK94843.1 phosphatase YcdX [Fundidesulfovibrio magnetotacticus]
MPDPAALFPRFSRLTRADLLVEQHLHTTWTDGHAAPEACLERARELGLSRVLFTDHVRAASDYCPRYLDEMGRLARKEETLRVLAGFEAKATDLRGGLDIPPAALERADAVIVSVHSIPLPGGGLAPPSSLDAPTLARAERDLAVAAAEAGRATLLGHAGGMSLAYHGQFPLAFLEDIVRACAAHGFPMEVNSRYHRPLLRPLLELMSRFDPPVSIGSDSHHIDTLGECSRLLARELFGEEA